MNSKDFYLATACLRAAQKTNAEDAGKWELLIDEEIKRVESIQKGKPIEENIRQKLLSVMHCSINSQEAVRALVDCLLCYMYVTFNITLTDKEQLKKIALYMQSRAEALDRIKDSALKDGVKQIVKQEKKK